MHHEYSSGAEKNTLGILCSIHVRFCLVFESGPLLGFILSYMKLGSLVAHIFFLNACTPNCTHKNYARPIRLEAQLHKYFHVSVRAMYPGAFFCQSIFNGAKLYMCVKTHLKVLFPLLMYLSMRKHIHNICM